VGKINPNNGYNTPTGLYTYKLSNYISKPLFDLEEFKKKFPFASQRPYAQFLVVKDDAVILNSKTPSRQLDTYVDEIGQLYKTNDNIMGLCNNWVNGTYQSYYGKSHHVTHKLWLFIFDVAAYIKGSKINVFSSLCRKIGIDGFDDDECVGWIHPNEKCQTVFFKAGLFKDQYEIEMEYMGDYYPSGEDPNNRELSDDKILELLSRGKFNIIEKFDMLMGRSKNPKIADYLKKYISGMATESFVKILTNADDPKSIKGVMGAKWGELVPTLTGSYLTDVLNPRKAENKGEITQLLLQSKDFTDALSDSSVARIMKGQEHPKELFSKLLDFESVRYFINKGNLYQLLSSGSHRDVIIDGILGDDRVTAGSELCWAIVENSYKPSEVLDKLPPEFINSLPTNESLAYNFSDYVSNIKNPDDFFLAVGDRIFSNWDKQGKFKVAEIISDCTWYDAGKMFKHFLSKDYVVNTMDENILHGMLYRTKDRDSLNDVILGNRRLVDSLSDDSIKTMMKFSSEPGYIVRTLKTMGKGLKGNTDVTTVD